MSCFRIAGGRVYDPVNGMDGVVRDLWIQDGRIVAPPAEAALVADWTLDAAGLLVLPGGVDMHTHIASAKVNLGRQLRPEERRRAPAWERTALTRSGTIGSVPTTFATGYLYAGLGYTTAIDASVPPAAARHVHAELADTPMIDAGFLTLLGNNLYALQLIGAGEFDQLRAYAGWLLQAVKGYGIKLVNPGGVEAWKEGAVRLDDLDRPVSPFQVTSRQIIGHLAQTAIDLGLPHAVHIHCNNLGLPGNWTTTLATMQALEGRRAHLAHIQFHSYGGDPSDPGSIRSRVPELVEYFNSHPNLTLDVGQVLFGETTTMTADSPVGYYLHQVTGRKWIDEEIELECGCGIVPIEYRDRNLVHALQWAIGLEWFLLAKDPWRIALTTDHPNGASFRAYPEIIRLLMDRAYRQEIVQKLPPRVLQRCTLAELDREYTLSEIAIITRAAPARILGLPHKGHLGPGADADVAIYAPGSDWRSVFEFPRYVIKGGELIVEEGEIRQTPVGRTLSTAPEFDSSAVSRIREWYEERATVQFENYSLRPEELMRDEVVVDCTGSTTAS